MSSLQQLSGHDAHIVVRRGNLQGRGFDSDENSFELHSDTKS